jgi:DNA-binding NarL/FixJ family response regulator
MYDSAGLLIRKAPNELMNSVNRIPRILLADDQQMFLDGLGALLEGDSRWQIAGQALNGQQALEVLEKEPVDLLITDLSISGIIALSWLKSVRQKYPDTRILVLTTYQDPRIVSEVLLTGAEGYILKKSGRQELIEAVGALLEGRTHYEKSVLNQMVEKIRQDKKIVPLTRELTPREQEVLVLIAQEHTSREIAEKLCISKQTVDSHRMNIIQKTGARTLAGVVKYAFMSGLIK